MKAPPKEGPCFNCGAKCDEDCWCFGCRTFCCTKCERADGTGKAGERGHMPADHLGPNVEKN